jgi:hypothetical protein
MNRSQRRKLKKQAHGQNMIINPGGENVDRQDATWCWLHKLKLENIDHPTDRDKKLIESVAFVIHKVTEKDGSITSMKVCPRCGNTIVLKKPVGGAGVQGFTIT